MRLAIVGTRLVQRGNKLWSPLNKRCGELVLSVFQSVSRKDTTIISGGASSGADWWAKKYAADLRYKYLEIPALWRNAKGYNSAAGFMRNQWVAEECTHMVAVWDGESNGTRDVLTKAQSLGRAIWILEL